MKEFWKNLPEEIKLIHKIKSVENRDEYKFKKACKDRWDNMTIDERIAFNKTMKEVNTTPSKIEQNRKTAIENWENPDFRHRQMELRDKKKKEKLKNGIKIKTNSEGLRLKWQDPEWKSKILESRRKKRLEKKNETN